MKRKPLKPILVIAALLVFSVSTRAQMMKNSPDIIVTYDSIRPKVTLLPFQKKYGELLGVDPTSLTNSKLYNFIDKWIGKPYLLGGETEDGIDCSSLTQLLYTEVYDVYIERTAPKQFKSENTNKFRGKEYLKEGDLVFFKSLNKDEKRITHVGIYLHNNKFLNATSFTADTGSDGVKISDLSYPYWQKRFLAGGKRKK